MIVFFPLNSFLLMQEGLSGGKQVQAEGAQSIQGIVKGTETKRAKTKPQAVEEPKYQPIRKEGAKDLVLPDAHASVVIDADTGTVLQYKNDRQQRQIASLTKIMTAVLAVEKIKNLDEEVTIDEEAVYTAGTKIGCPCSGRCNSQRLQIGEKISARNLLKAALLNSANDAAIALGKHISGSQDDFAELMNKKAKSLGLTDTHFCTPSGLEPDGKEAECYSSAHDIAKIAAYSLRYDEIWKVFKLLSSEEPITIKSADGKIEHTVLNTLSNLNQIQNTVGGKTGFTPLAGYSLLSVIKDPSEKHKIVAVVLDDVTRWQDIKDMAEWTFNSYTWK